MSTRDLYLAIVATIDARIVRLYAIRNDVPEDIRPDILAIASHLTDLADTVESWALMV